MTVLPTQPPRLTRRLRVILVRHGETQENVAGIIQGQLDTPLNSFGRLQATTTADYLSTIRFNRVITSPLQRARDTAQAILSKQLKGGNVELEQYERLKERCFGALEGKVYVGPKKKSESTEGIEKTPDFLERLAGFWNELITVHGPSHFEESASFEQHEQRSEEGDEHVILFVSHGAAISALLNDVLLSGQYIHVPSDIQISQFQNCSITELVVPTILDRRTPSPLKMPGPPHLMKECAVKPPHVQQLEGKSDKVGTTEYPRADETQAADGPTVLQDLGFGKGVGYVVRWGETMHLQGLTKVGEALTQEQGHTTKVNVDELVGK